jgi:hypothetical protein
MRLLYRGFRQVVQASVEDTAFSESRLLAAVPAFLSRCYPFFAKELFFFKFLAHPVYKM